MTKPNIIVPNLNRRELLRRGVITGSSMAALGALAGCGSDAQGSTSGDASGCESDAAVEKEIVRENEGVIKQTMSYKMPTQRTRGNYSVMQTVIDPHQLIPPHMHFDADQAVLILQGGPFQIQFDLENGNEEVLEMALGDFAIKPRNLSHAFWNPTDEPATYLEFSTRGSFQTFIDIVDEGDGSQDEIDAAAEETGNVFFNDLIPDLLLKHGLTSIKGYGGVSSALCELYFCE